MARILVVEDEWLLAILLWQELEDEGHSVETASNGEDALRYLLNNPPQLIITDFAMPLMNGFELAKEVRKDSRLSAVPIILVTGQKRSDLPDRLDLFCKIFPKPYRTEDILEAVKDLLNPLADQTEPLG